MSFEEWLANDLVMKHAPSPDEVANLLIAAGRNTADAKASVISVDRRFMLAYEAALGLAMVVSAAGGYRTRSVAHHAIVIRALPVLIGEDTRVMSNYLDDCRKLRHTLMYERVGLATQSDVTKPLVVVEDLRRRVLGWLAEEHPELLPEGAQADGSSSHKTGG